MSEPTQRRKVCVVITARPSYARIKTALAAIRDHDDLELQLVVGASALLDRYGSVIDVIRADGFEPSETVYMILEGENLVTSAKSTGIGILELATIFDKLQPDAVLSIADRFETIATAIAGSYMNIPVVHVQGGEVTGSIDEKVRHAVTKLSNLHLVSNDQAAERVRRMGEEPASVVVTGCPSVDLAATVKAENNGPFDPNAFGGVGATFDPEEGYIVVMQHPVTTEYEDARAQVEETLEAVIELNLPTYWFWPNVDAGSDAVSKMIRTYREFRDIPKIRFMKNLPPEDFLRMLMHARLLVGNSSVGIREASFLGVRTVNIGTRQNGRDRAENVADVGFDRRSILKACKEWLAVPPPSPSTLYGDGKAGTRIADAIAASALPIDKKITY